MSAMWEIKRRLNRLSCLGNAQDEQTRFGQAVREVEAMMEESRLQYDSPEEVRKRQEQYNEIQRIGALRKAAFCRGEGMDAYPLPWEVGKE